MITLGQGRTTVQVGTLRYKYIFRYNGYLYMRIDSKQFKSELIRRGGRFDTERTSLNTQDEVVVLRLSNGKLSFFQRHTCVTPVTLDCQIKEMEDEC